MLTHSDQVELALARPPMGVAVPIELVRVKKSGGAAFTLACDTSGLDDKEIYLALEIDAGYFSNMKKGKATLQADMIAEFCKVVGNTIYLEWQAYQVGCTLVMLKTEAERRAEEQARRADAAEEKVRLLTQVLQGRAAA